MAEGQEWVKLYETTERTLNDLSSDLRSRRGGSREKRSITKRLTQAKEDIGRLAQDLEDLGKRKKIGEGELQRRAGLMSSLNVLYEGVNDIMSGASRRADLYQTASARGETEETKDLDNHQLVAQMKEQQDRQDQQIDSVLDVVQKVKAITYDMGNELTLQDHLMSDLSDAVDSTDQRMVRNTERVEDIEERSSGWCGIIMIILLLILIIVLATVNLCNILPKAKC